MKDTIGFNLNYTIYVKFSDKGLRRLVRRRNQLLGINGYKIKEMRAKQDAEGFTALQGWEFVEMMGGTSQTMMGQLFDMNIRISKQGVTK